jgi:hypothetical protein
MNRAIIILAVISFVSGSVYCLVSHRGKPPLISDAVVSAGAGSSRLVEFTPLNFQISAGATTNDAAFRAPGPAATSGDNLETDPAPTDLPPQWEPVQGADSTAGSALAAAMKLPEGDERNRALAAACFSLAQTNPADAVKLAQTLQLDQPPGAVMENLVQQWAMSDATSALAWAGQQPAGTLRDALMTRVAYAMSQTDPALAANLAINLIPPGTAQDEAVMMVVNQWGNQNLTAAAQWVGTFPDGPLQHRAVEELEGIKRYQQELAQQ